MQCAANWGDLSCCSSPSTGWWSTTCENFNCHPALTGGIKVIPNCLLGIALNLIFYEGQIIMKETSSSQGSWFLESENLNRLLWPNTVLPTSERWLDSTVHRARVVDGVGFGHVFYAFRPHEVVNIHQHGEAFGVVDLGTVLADHDRSGQVGFAVVIRALEEKISNELSLVVCFVRFLNRHL